VTTIPPFLVNPQTNQPVVINGNLVPLIGPKGLLGPGDHVLLSASAVLAQGIGIPVQAGGTGLPLPASVVLLAADAATINAQVQQFNTIIEAAASQAGAAYVDINSLLQELSTTGIEVGGIPFNADFLTGGVFSYDGVHPTAFGYAFIANTFIDAINAKFGGAIPEADLATAMFVPESAGSPAEIGSLEAGRAALHQAIWTRYLFTEAATKNLESILVPPATTGGKPHHHR
jgi:outer membrane murein-binding lipoprotein Lpp